MFPSWNYATDVELSISLQMPNQHHQKLPLRSMNFEFYWHLVVICRHCTLGDYPGLWSNSGLFRPGICGWVTQNRHQEVDCQLVYRCTVTNQWNTVQNFTITDTLLPRSKIQTKNSWFRTPELSQIYCTTHHKPNFARAQNFHSFLTNPTFSSSAYGSAEFD